MGVDAEAVAKVEAQREKGSKVTPTRYITAAMRATVGYSRKQPRLTVELPGREPMSGVLLRLRVQLQPVDLCR